MCFVDILIDQILHLMAIYPSLDTRSPGNDSQFVPSFIVQIMMPVLNFFFRGKPTRPQRLTINETCGRRALPMVSLHFNLWSIHPASPQIVTLPYREWPYLRSDLNS